jgi:UDP-glucose:(heptosyl)LPS alpha-1,3-glucosyltransferase
MKLVFIKKNFSIHGGVEKYMKTLLDYLTLANKDKKYKAEIHVIAKKWADSPGIIFHKVNPLPLGSFISAIAFNSAVHKKIEKLKPDCVISFERTTCQDIYRAGEGCHKEWLKIRTRIEPLWKRLSFLINPLHITMLRIEKKLFSKSKLIIAISEMVKSQIIQNYNVPDKKIKVIYNGVDLKKFSPENSKLYRSEIRGEYSIANDTKLILFVGSGFKRKGLKTALQAISSMQNKNQTSDTVKIKLMVIGKGNVKKYRSLAVKYKVDDLVLFIKPQKDIEKFYAAADIFVLPTFYDPFGNVMIEAMASGLPVITTRSSGASELIQNGNEGFVLEDPADFNTLAEYINKTLLNKKLMGEKARLKAENYPIEKAADEYMKNIMSIVSQTNTI